MTVGFYLCAIVVWAFVMEPATGHQHKVAQSVHRRDYHLDDLAIGILFLLVEWTLSLPQYLAGFGTQTESYLFGACGSLIESNASGR
jgi:TRAP-type mannitol/chloroaromatic compound transport system permease large subunit